MHAFLNYLETTHARKAMLEGKVSLDPGLTPREGFGRFAPPIPFDKFFKGRMFLSRHGDEFISPKS